MDLRQAFEHFTKSEVFKEKVKGRDSAAGKLRGYYSRFNSGLLKEQAIRKLLIEYGYTVKETWQPPKKKR